MQTIQVLMSTYNGEKYLSEQLDSIFSQEGLNIQLLVRDDGSTDRTVAILREYEKDKCLTLIEGQNVGYRKSFLWLLDHSPDSEFYAFADQDDVWENNKLLTALQMLQAEKDDKPILYTSALTCVNENLEFLRVQNFKGLKLNAYSEVVRHRFAGCTYVFNRKLRNISWGVSKVSSMNYEHDGYLCLMCWLSGGKIIYDETPHIKFRRHGNNASADGVGKWARIKHEFAFLTKKRHQKSNAMQIIWTYKKEEIVPEYIKLVDSVANYKYKKGGKLAILRDRRFDCGIKAANILFKFSVLIGCM